LSSPLVASNRRLTLFLILFRKVIIERGQSPLEDIEGLQQREKYVSIKPEAKEEWVKYSTYSGC
jgi:hypothetical protein